jgi:hypothetical protein
LPEMADLHVTRAPSFNQPRVELFSIWPVMSGGVTGRGAKPRDERRPRAAQILAPGRRADRRSGRRLQRARPHSHCGALARCRRAGGRYGRSEGPGGAQREQGAAALHPSAIPADLFNGWNVAHPCSHVSSLPSRSGSLASSRGTAIRGSVMEPLLFSGLRLGSSAIALFKVSGCARREDDRDRPDLGRRR